MAGLLSCAARLGVDARLHAVVLVSRRAMAAVMWHEAAGSVRFSRALYATAAGSLYAAWQLQLAAPRDTS